MDRVTQRLLTEEDLPFEAFYFQREKISFQMCIQAWNLWRESQRLEAVSFQDFSKRGTERAIASHDQISLIIDKFIVVSGVILRNPLHPDFIGAGRAAGEVNATCLEFHDKQRVEGDQFAFGPDFNRGEVDCAQDVSVCLEKHLPSTLPFPLRAGSIP